MPTYRYRCKSCSHEFDQFQKFVEDALTVCPECGQEIRRVIQPVGVVFKGSGWYINDSRPAAKDPGSSSSSENSDMPETSDKPESKPAAEKSDVKSESKSETKIEKKSESKETKTAAPA